MSASTQPPQPPVAPARRVAKSAPQAIQQKVPVSSKEKTAIITSDKKNCRSDCKKVPESSQQQLVKGQSTKTAQEACSQHSGKSSSTPQQYLPQQPTNTHTKQGEQSTLKNVATTNLNKSLQQLHESVQSTVKLAEPVPQAVKNQKGQQKQVQPTKPASVQPQQNQVNKKPQNSSKQPQTIQSKNIQQQSSQLESKSITELNKIVTPKNEYINSRKEKSDLARKPSQSNKKKKSEDENSRIATELNCNQTPDKSAITNEKSNERKQQTTNCQTQDTTNLKEGSENNESRRSEISAAVGDNSSQVKDKAIAKHHTSVESENLNKTGSVNVTSVKVADDIRSINSPTMNITNADKNSSTQLKQVQEITKECTNTIANNAQIPNITVQQDSKYSEAISITRSTSETDKSELLGCVSSSAPVKCSESNVSEIHVANNKMIPQKSLPNSTSLTQEISPYSTTIIDFSNKEVVQDNTNNSLPLQDVQEHSNIDSNGSESNITTEKSFSSSTIQNPLDVSIQQKLTQEEQSASSQLKDSEKESESVDEVALSSQLKLVINPSTTGDMTSITITPATPITMSYESAKKIEANISPSNSTLSIPDTSEDDLSESCSLKSDSTNELSSSAQELTDTTKGTNIPGASEKTKEIAIPGLLTPPPSPPILTPIADSSKQAINCENSKNEIENNSKTETKEIVQANSLAKSSTKSSKLSSELIENYKNSSHSLKNIEELDKIIQLSAQITAQSDLLDTNDAKVTSEFLKIFR